MYINTGSGKNIRSRRVIGIFDMDSATVCIATRNLLSKMQKEGSVVDTDGDIPKSFILADKEVEKIRDKRNKTPKSKQSEIILCKFSSGVLFGRIDNEQALAALSDSGEEDL